MTRPVICRFGSTYTYLGHKWSTSLTCLLNRSDVGLKLDPFNVLMTRLFETCMTFKILIL